MSDPFALLGLPRRPWLDEGIIRAAFQERARHSHPDAEAGNADAFTALNTAQAALANPATRLRLLAGATPLPAMPSDIQLGFRVAGVMRNAEALREKECVSSNVLTRALLMQETSTVRRELEEVAAALKISRDALDGRLRKLDECWPAAAPEELAVLAGEYIFLSRWQKQAREAGLALQIAFGKSDGGRPSRDCPP